jgi:hypothetical protein
MWDVNSRKRRHLVLGLWVIGLKFLPSMQYLYGFLAALQSHE